MSLHTIRQLIKPLNNVISHQHTTSIRYTTYNTVHKLTTTYNSNNKYYSTFNNNNTIDRPFRILGIQQIAIGHTNKSELSNLWCNIFGLKQINTFVSEKENVDEDILICGIGELGSIEIDLMQPLDINKKPAVHIPQLNHIGLWVDNIHKCVEYLTQQGVRFTPGGIRKGAAGYDVTFIHPKGNEQSPLSGCGVLIELVQAPQNVIDAYEKQSKHENEVVQ